MLRKKLAVLVAAAMMLAMAASPAAWAAPGNNGRGAANANPNATSGISTAVEHSGCGGACEPA